MRVHPVKGRAELGLRTSVGDGPRPLQGDNAHFSQQMPLLCQPETHRDFEVDERLPPPGRIRTNTLLVYNRPQLAEGQFLRRPILQYEDYGFTVCANRLDCV